MLKFSKIHFDYMKTFVPFYDAYVLIDAKEKTADHVADCIIDRRYTKLQYMVFAMILRDSDETNLEANLRLPGKWIDEALKAQTDRKIEQATQQQINTAMSLPKAPVSTSNLARSLFDTEHVIHDKLGSNLLKETLTHDAVKDYRSQVAIQHQTKEQIEQELKEAVEIVFEADETDLPLYASSNWQFLVDLRYRFTKLKNVQKSIRRQNTIAKNKAKEASNG